MTMSKYMMAKRRREFLKAVPWITWLDKRHQCDGYRWGAMPLRAIHQWGSRDNPKPPIGKEKWRCKNAAHWRYCAKRNSDGKSGIYCQSHLWSQIYTNVEYDRFMKWRETYTEETPDPKYTTVK